MNIHLPMFKPNELMTPDLWKQVDYFDEAENWGSPYRMHVRLIFYVDLFREMLAKPYHVYCAYETAGHSATSVHPKGLAVDGGVANLRKAFMVAMRLPFTGVGLYRWWTPRHGLHLDMKPISYDKPKRVWYRDRVGIYHNINTLADLNTCLREKE